MNLVEYLKYVASGENLELVQNVPSGDLDDRSFIEYWEKQTHYVWDKIGYLCPATGIFCKREELDGAHVRKVGSWDKTIYITPVHRSFNRSKDQMPFKVKRKYLVKAPKQF